MSLAFQIYGIFQFNQTFWYQTQPDQCLNNQIVEGKTVSKLFIPANN